MKSRSRLAWVFANHVGQDFVGPSGKVMVCTRQIINRAVGCCQTNGSRSQSARRSYRSGGEGLRSVAFYRALSRIAAGATTGHALATAALLVFDRVYFGPAEGRLAAIGSTYFGVLSAAIAWSLSQRNEYQTVRRLLAASGLALILAPLANMATTGVDHWAGALAPGHAGARAALAADAVLAALGVLTIVASSRLPRERVERKRSIRAGAPALAE